DDKFRKPLRTEAQLLNAARSAAQDAAPIAAILIKHALPADFLKSLNADIQDFEQARKEYGQAKEVFAVGDKALHATMRKAMSSARRFDAIMCNTLRDDAAMLDAWKRVCRIERRKKSAGETKADGPAAD